jgi:hypothetical protein
MTETTNDEPVVRFDLNIDQDGNGTVTVVSDDGESVVVTNDHANFRRIVQACLAGEDPTPFLSVAAAVKAIDGRVEVHRNFVTFNGEAIDNSLTETILRWTREGRDTTGLVRFLENLQANPSQRSREQLFDWLQAKDITITEDGHFIGYKGVREDFRSCTAGPATVNGEDLEHDHVPNDVGNVIEVPREYVQVDPNQGCSTGLHVGNYSYARGFGQLLLEVKVNPADVVSVPADCSFQKLRCCRYEVVGVHEEDFDDLSDYEPEATAEDDDDLDVLEPYIPTSFLQRLRERFSRSPQAGED